MNTCLSPTNNCTFQVLQHSHSSAPLYPPIPWYQNSQHHRHLYYSLQTRLLQLTILQSPQLTARLQHIQNSVTRAVIKAPKFSHTTPILKSLHQLKVNERVEYKILSLTYKTLTTAQPAYLHNVISVQSPGRTRSSSLITIARPPSSSSLKITDLSFRYASLIPSTSFITCHTISPSITSSLFHSRLKTHLFYKSYPPECPPDFNRTIFKDSCIAQRFVLAFPLLLFCWRVCRTKLSLATFWLHGNKTFIHWEEWPSVKLS